MNATEQIERFGNNQVETGTGNHAHDVAFSHHHRVACGRSSVYCKLTATDIALVFEILNAHTGGDGE